MQKAIRFTFIALLLFGIITAVVIWPVYGFSVLAIGILAIGIYDIAQKQHTILRNFPVIGHMRYLLELVAPEIHQYFIESDTDGKPIDRNHRAYIYERAKLVNATHPFGTELEVYEENYEWMQHSIYPSSQFDKIPRVVIGGPECKQPYRASLLNISAMSFGALSSNAIKALNLGAKAGNFYHNTGEGGISKYHLQGGDLVYEVGTGYFGCRTEDGHFSEDKFKQQAGRPEVKMIELKLSQGAKPGHGGILPAKKNNREIAEIRGVEPHTTVWSPPGHSAFDDAKGLLQFITKMRDLSGGKPVGFKLCVGSKGEFEQICKEMARTGLKPDFITVDGAEGGTGAAPIDFSNYVGMPWEQGLIFVVDCLNGYDLKKDIRVITATKIITAFNIFKAISLGADLCNSARGMMLALGCIQALRCDTNNCPTGVTSNKPKFKRGLVVEEKYKRVKNYQHETLSDFASLFAASGCTELDQLNRSFVYKQINNKTVPFSEIYPEVAQGSYLQNLMT
ncbi:MAG: FMN-binding glutamate synthase family protein [Bacteroidales bacterium]|nr:FMN-binding glutamate synthase family protein [Bacteroidales bacterium]